MPICGDIFRATAPPPHACQKQNPAENWRQNRTRKPIETYRSIPVKPHSHRFKCERKRGCGVYVKANSLLETPDSTARWFFLYTPLVEHVQLCDTGIICLIKANPLLTTPRDIVLHLYLRSSRVKRHSCAKPALPVLYGQFPPSWNSNKKLRNMKMWTTSERA
jgi:hypothetical protein